MSTLTSIAVGALAVVLVFAGGYESGKKAERERMNELVIKEQINHAKSVSEATNSLVTASAEYDSVKRERDALALKLRRATSGGSKGSAAGACEARVASLERMVDGLLDLVERCDAGWNGCARRKDALSEAVK